MPQNLDGARYRAIQRQQLAHDGCWRLTVVGQPGHPFDHRVVMVFQTFDADLQASRRVLPGEDRFGEVGINLPTLDNGVPGGWDAGDGFFVKDKGKGEGRCIGKGLILPSPQLYRLALCSVLR